MKKNKFLAGVLSAAMVVGSLTLPENISIKGFDFGVLFAQAADELASGTCGEDLTWVLDDDGLLTISGTGDMNDYSAEKAPWYDKAEEIYTVVIENGVTSIGELAFYYCSMITSVDMPDSIENIDNFAFCGCYSIIEIEIPENVSTIGTGAFADCGTITSIQIPENVTSIGQDAFVNCSNLTEISVSEDNGVYVSYDGIIYSKDMTTLIYSPEGRIETAVIPDGVTTIGEYAFEYSRVLEGIEMPDSVTIIEDYAFYCCESIPQINISENVTKIGNRAFSGCESVTSIDLPESVSEMGEEVFYGCFSLVSVTLPDGITNIGDSTFRHCFCLTDVEIPSTVESIDDSAFSYCTSLVSIIIPEGVTKIGSSAFWECSSLINIDIPDTVTDIENSAFCNCYSLLDVTIYNSDVSIGYGTFANCSSLTLYGYSSSTAETYASVNDIPFIALPDNEQVGDIEADFSDVTLVSGETLSENAEIVMDYVFKGEYFSSEEGLAFLSEIVAPLNNGEQSLASVITDAVNASTSEALDMTNYELLSNVFDIRITVDGEVIEGVQNVEVSFDVYNLEDGMEIALLHYDTTDGVWEVYDDLTIDGTNVTVTLSSLSPVALIYIPPISITEYDIVVEYDAAQYTGSALEPQVTIEGLEEGTDYTVSYENNTNAGTATVTVTGIGAYGDTYTATFEITKADQIVSATLSSDVIIIGETSQITVSGIGEVSYEYSDEEIITVSEDGLVTSIGVGTAEIVITFAGDDNTNSASTSLMITVEDIPYTLGDVNQDGDVNYLDAMMVLRYDAMLIELDENQFLAGDVNDDGEVNSLDAIRILRYDAGLIDSFQ